MRNITLSGVSNSHKSCISRNFLLNRLIRYKLSDGCCWRRTSIIKLNLFWVNWTYLPDCRRGATHQKVKRERKFAVASGDSPPSNHRLVWVQSGIDEWIYTSSSSFELRMGLGGLETSFSSENTYLDEGDPTKERDLPKASKSRTDIVSCWTCFPLKLVVPSAVLLQPLSKIGIETSKRSNSASFSAGTSQDKKFKIRTPLESRRGFVRSLFDSSFPLHFWI